MSPKCFRSALVLAALAAAATARGQEAAGPRSDLETFALALDRAVARVSRPAHGGFLPAASPGTRGYHLKGYGAVFVVTPRALPAARPRAQEAEAARALEQAARRLEQALSRVDRSELRRRMEETLKALRETEAELRPVRGGAPEPGALPEGLTPLPGGDPDLELEIMAEAEALRQDAQLAQSEVERSLAAIERQVRGQLAAPAAPLPPAAPAPPAPPATVVAPAPPTAPEPPWSFWFEHEPPDGRSPERVIHDVGAAVSEVLETHGPRLRVVPSEEAVVVAVDFVARPRQLVVGWDSEARARTERTLVVRVRKRELEARVDGKLAADELRKRIELVEY